MTLGVYSSRSFGFEPESLGAFFFCIMTFTLILSVHFSRTFTFKHSYILVFLLNDVNTSSITDVNLQHNSIFL